MSQLLLTRRAVYSTSNTSTITSRFNSISVFLYYRDKLDSSERDWLWGITFYLRGTIAGSARPLSVAKREIGVTFTRLAWFEP